MGIHDLNSGLNIFCDSSGFVEPGVTHERGQDAVCSSHKTPAQNSGARSCKATLANPGFGYDDRILRFATCAGLHFLLFGLLANLGE